MASRTINKGLKRTALSIALGMAFASTVVLAQSAVGSIYGDAAAGSTVTIENVNSGQSRDITAGSDGRFFVLTDYSLETISRVAAPRVPKRRAVQ